MTIAKRPYAAADDAHSILAHGAAVQITRLLAVAWITMFVLVGGGGAWAAFFSISGAVLATGSVAVDGKRKLVQHLDGGTVARIHVKDGAEVAAGTVLITLDGRELKNERASLEGEIAARARQVTLIESELVGLLELQAKKLVANTRVSLLQRDAAGIAADLARLSSQKSKTEARVARLAIHAPVAGWVHNLSANTVGGVLAPGATVGEIVPSNSGLLIEAKLSPTDIDQVRPGMKTSVRMTSFNQRTTPTVEGAVEQSSADLSRDDQRSAAYYLARITLPAASLNRIGGSRACPACPLK